MLEKLYNPGIIYGLIALSLTIASAYVPTLRSVALVVDVAGALFLAWDIFGPRISMRMARSIPLATPIGENDIWKFQLPERTLELHPNAISANVSPNNTHGGLRVEVRKLQGIDDPVMQWEGPELQSRRADYQMILANVAIDFEESSAERGNIYLFGRGPSDRFDYLVGIDNNSREIFYHIWDNDEGPSPGASEEGSYISERGRTHLKDYLDDPDDEGVVLGLEWGLDGAKFLAFSKGEKDVVHMPANPPPKLRSELLSDARSIALFGVPQFGIRIDLAPQDDLADAVVVASIRGAYGRIAPLFWLPTLLEKLSSIKRLPGLLRRTFAAVIQGGPDMKIVPIIASWILLLMGLLSLATSLLIVSGIVSHPTDFLGTLLILWASASIQLFLAAIAVKIAKEFQ